MTCSELKMNSFIKALLGDKDTLSEIGSFWEDIYNEYIGLRENKSSSYILSLMKEITYLQTKVFIITKCCEVLASTYSRELVMEVLQCGCKGKFDYSDPVAYSNDIRAAISFAKKYVGQISRKEKELKDYQERHGGKVIERKEFDIWAITLGKWMGYRIDYNVVTVSEWCHMMNQYEKYCEVENGDQNNLMNKHG